MTPPQEAAWQWMPSLRCGWLRTVDAAEQCRGGVLVSAGDAHMTPMARYVRHVVDHARHGRAVVVVVSGPRLELWHRRLVSLGLSVAVHHGAKRPRWVSLQSVGSVLKPRAEGVNSSLPVALSRLLGHDVVLTSFSALAAEEWTPPGVGDRGSCGGGGSNSAPVSDRGVTSADVSLDEIEDCSSSSDAGCENVRPFSTVSALRHVSASTDTPFASNTTPWLSCGDGASSARGKRLSCLHQIFWHSALIEDAHMALSSRSKTSRALASLRVEGEQWWVVPEASARKTKGVVAAVRQLHSSRTGASPDAGCFWM